MKLDESLFEEVEDLTQKALQDLEDKDKNYELDKQADREAKVELAKQGIVTEEVEDKVDIEKFIKDGYPYSREKKGTRYFFPSDIEELKNISKEECIDIAKKYKKDDSYALIKYYQPGNGNNYILWVKSYEEAKEYWEEMFLGFTLSYVYKNGLATVIDLANGKDVTKDFYYNRIMYADYWYDPYYTDYVFDNFEEAEQKAKELGIKDIFYTDLSDWCQVVWLTEKDKGHLHPTVMFKGKGKLKDAAPEFVNRIMNRGPKNETLKEDLPQDFESLPKEERIELLKAENERKTLLRAINNIGELVNKNPTIKQDWKLIRDLLRQNNILKEDLSQEEQKEYGLNTLVNNLIKSELDAVDDYNSAIVTFEAEGKGDYTDVIRDIINEEQTHIGQLQAILADLQPNSTENIDSGIKEGEGQIEEGGNNINNTLEIK